MPQARQGVELLRHAPCCAQSGVAGCQPHRCIIRCCLPPPRAPSVLNMPPTPCLGRSRQKRPGREEKAVQVAQDLGGRGGRSGHPTPRYGETPHVLGVPPQKLEGGKCLDPPVEGNKYAATHPHTVHGLGGGLRPFSRPLLSSSFKKTQNVPVKRGDNKSSGSLLEKEQPLHRFWASRSSSARPGGSDGRARPHIPGL